MAIEVKLPSLGDDIDTGDVLELLVKEGDVVAKDQGIIELETGKATLQVPSSAAGKVSKIHVKTGQTIPPGALLLTLEATEAGAKGDRGQGTGDGGQPTTTRPAEKRDAVPSTQYSVPSTAPSPRTASPQPQPSPEAPPPHESAPVPPFPKSQIPNPKSPPEPRTLNPEPLPTAAGPAVRRFARE